MIEDIKKEIKENIGDKFADKYIRFGLKIALEIIEKHEIAAALKKEQENSKKIGITETFVEHQIEIQKPGKYFFICGGCGSRQIINIDNCGTAPECSSCGNSANMYVSLAGG